MSKIVFFANFIVVPVLLSLFQWTTGLNVVLAAIVGVVTLVYAFTSIYMMNTSRIAVLIEKQNLKFVGVVNKIISSITLFYAFVMLAYLYIDSLINLI